MSWKYWHACKLHVQALGLVTAFDTWKEVVEEGFAEFGLTREEAKSCTLHFHQFRDKLSQQGLNYEPDSLKYPGDKQMRVNTKKRKRGESSNGGKKWGRGRPRNNGSMEGDDYLLFLAVTK